MIAVSFEGVSAVIAVLSAWTCLFAISLLLAGQVSRERGKVVRRFFARGRRSDPADGERRAIGVLAASIAPDSFVLRTLAERDSRPRSTSP